MTQDLLTWMVTFNPPVRAPNHNVWEFQPHLNAKQRTSKQLMLLKTPVKWWCCYLRGARVASLSHPPSWRSTLSVKKLLPSGIKLKMYYYSSSFIFLQCWTLISLQTSSCGASRRTVWPTLTFCAILRPLIKRMLWTTLALLLLNCVSLSDFFFPVCLAVTANTIRELLRSLQTATLCARSFVHHGRPPAAFRATVLISTVRPVMIFRLSLHYRSHDTCRCSRLKCKNVTNGANYWEESVLFSKQVPFKWNKAVLMLWVKWYKWQF